MKLKINLTIIFSLLLGFTYGQERKTDVLTLGTFHFAFHNKDVIKTVKSDQIDVLDRKYQLEIEEIVRKISQFKPTIIAIERSPEFQPHIDSLYNRYIAGTYTLNREEYEQIGFRLGKMLGIKKIYCVNDWGRYYSEIDSLLATDRIANKKFMDFFYHNPDTAKIRMSFPEDVFKTQGIKAELRLKNDEKNIQKDLGSYLIGIFKYETETDPFFGTDYVTGWWFNRNLRIFRNIQKIDRKPTDKILVIYGAGHMGLLNIFFKSSPEFRLVRTNDYLK
jgi:hypothetical protein